MLFVVDKVVNDLLKLGVIRADVDLPVIEEVDAVPVVFLQLLIPPVDGTHAVGQRKDGICRNQKAIDRIG